MSSMATMTEEQPPPAATSMSVGEDDLARLLDTVARIEALQAEAVTLAGQLASAGVAERSAGLPLDLLLATEQGLTGGDRHTLITAGQVLATMPRLAAAHRAGAVSWGQVRAVVALLRRRSLADRAVVDARIGATLDGPVERGDPDAFVEAVSALVDELRTRRAVEQREQRQAAANRLWAQPGLDGRVHGGFAYDEATAAVVLNAIAAQQGRPAADEADRPPEIPTPQQRSAAAALAEICQAHLAGGAGQRRARPAYVVDVQLADLDTTQPGWLRLRLPGARPRVSLRRIADDALAGATVRVVLSDQAAPLAASTPVATDTAGVDLDAAQEWARALAISDSRRSGLAALIAAVNRALQQPDLLRAAAGERPLCDPALLDAEAVCTATRAAVLARDGGCRFYGCAAPIDWCDVHHLDDRASGRHRHHPDRLITLCRPCHRRVHILGWALDLDPKTGTLTGRWEAGTRAWQTLPRGTPLARGPDPPDRSPPRRTTNTRTSRDVGLDDLPF